MAKIVDISFEHSHFGLGIQSGTPRLSWKFACDDESICDFTQTASEITLKPVHRNPEAKTYRIEGSESIWVSWPGPPLHARQRMLVRVRAYASWINSETKDQAQGVTPWSEWAEVECALLGRDDWTAVPIARSLPQPPAAEPIRPVLFRQAFDLPANCGLVDRARLYFTAYGVYRAYLNGIRVGDHEMGPGWTSYHHRLAYQVCNVTSMIRERNVISIEVAEGWYAGRLGFDSRKRHLYGDQIGPLAQLEIFDPQGQVLRVDTDGSWKCHASPLIRSEIYDGERYDMRQDLGRNWASDPNYDDSGWESVVTLPFPTAQLVVPRAPPVRVTQRVHPQQILTTPSGRLVLDFGQNLVGKLHVRSISVLRNAAVSFIHAEVLENGELGIRPLRDAKCTDTIISSGESLINWEPKFTFHGFRYVQIDGWDPRDESGADGKSPIPWQDNITALVMHTDFTQTGWFECSHESVNQLHRNTQWSMRGNFLSIPTDCPQRDERLGWTGDIQIFSPSATFLYRSTGMLADWMDDVAAEQSDHAGVPPLVVPNILDHVWPSMPQAVWDDVVIILPWVLYQASGDLEILQRQYPSMTTWLSKGVRRGEDQLWDPELWQLGDWLDPQAPADEPGDGRTNGTLVADAYLVYVTSILARISELLGKKAEHIHYQEQASRLRTRFHEKYVTSTGLMVSDSQTAYALAIALNLIYSAAQHATISRQLSRLVRAAKFRVATGFAGTPIILHALTQTNNLPLAYRMLLEDGCPSWLYPITQGATTIWERWDSMLPDGSINPGTMTSFNHYALGSVVQWLHETVGGLKALEPGWKTALVAPRPGGVLTHASVAHESGYGRWECRWEVIATQSEGETVLAVEILVPPNARAVVRLPNRQEETVGSGRYRFTVSFVPEPYPPKAIEPFITNPGQGL
ncbi:bacterial alpha-L-rhamnosidase-domain-containing protein [Aspergillus pseudoustus]|uniref:alpha-L-rhamnosidase n=1 Tax=Aspergillus pseudoustus TaxID=1810923 RepID=A0ABR4KIK8_9EURO